VERSAEGVEWEATKGFLRNEEALVKIVDLDAKLEEAARAQEEIEAGGMEATAAAAVRLWDEVG